MPLTYDAYQYLYNFLLVLDEEQIVKLRRIITGSESLTAFSEAEIKALQNKLKDRGLNR